MGKKGGGGIKRKGESKNNFLFKRGKEGRVSQRILWSPSVELYDTTAAFSSMTLHCCLSMDPGDFLDASICDRYRPSLVRHIQ